MDLKTLEEVIDCLRTPPAGQEASSRFFRLDEESSRCVLGAAAFPGRFAKLRGSEKQRLFVRLLDEGVRSESDLRSWLGEISFPVTAKGWDAGRKRAEQLLGAGMEVFRPASPVAAHPEDRPDTHPCPGIFFGKSCPPDSLPLLAVFNSRKPRQVLPGCTWLDVLRRFLSGVDQRKIGFIGSTGTLTYDLASVFARKREFLKLLAVPFPLLSAERQLFQLFGEETNTVPVLSCMLDGPACRGKLPMRCRDRFLAAFSDLHLVLEIRSGGNLEAILTHIQSKSPRPQYILKPGSLNSSNSANLLFLNKFAEHATGFEAPRRARPVEHRDFSRAAGRTSISTISWREYLFHYTRTCSGPWPGETYREYLLGLLAGSPLPGRLALDVLVRIAQEKLLRAGSGMVRGNVAVVCWSSLPPREFFVMRKWRRGLARWTAEPYGVAVRRDVLRSLGAKPAIYGSGELYSKLPEPEKFRFQISRSAPSASWRHEREWRTSGDLRLEGIRPHQGFYFVQTAEEAERLCARAAPGLPVVALDDADR